MQNAEIKSVAFSVSESKIRQLEVSTTLEAQIMKM
jgi:hypothetical protein